MQTPRLLLTTLTLAASVALGATALAATQDDTVPEAPATSPDGGDTVAPTGEVAEPDEGPGTEVVPNREVAEPDEGPGTDVVPPRDVEYEGPGTDTPPVRDGVEYEGPGTDIAPPGTTARYDCRVLDGRRVCDTFDESNEGPGT